MPGTMQPTQALKMLQGVAMNLVADAKAQEMDDLTLRQVAILLTVYLEPPPHTVRGLAQKLVVTKPVITRALDAMGKYNLIGRRRDEADRRNVIIQRTVAGSLFVERIGDQIVARMSDVLD